jgi:hypothetical protein
MEKNCELRALNQTWNIPNESRIINLSVDIYCYSCYNIPSKLYIRFNPLPALTLQSAWDLNVPCRPKRSKVLLF